MSVEVEVLQPEGPGYYWVGTKVRYYFDDRLILELDSAISRPLVESPLTWLERSLKTRYKAQSCPFSDFNTPHVLVIGQHRLSKLELVEIQKELGVEAFPYPFLYDLSLLVNHDAETIPYCGLGMRFGGLSYHEVRAFLSQLQTEVYTALP
jgi:hypothetical protein